MARYFIQKWQRALKQKREEELDFEKKQEHRIVGFRVKVLSRAFLRALESNVQEMKEERDKQRFKEQMLQKVNMWL
jgi:hypothetical protein